MLRAQPIENFTGRVVGAVVDHDELDELVRVVEREQRGHRAFDDELFVPARHEHADERPVAEVETTARLHVEGRRPQG